jgi:hypothetical protein
MRYLITNNEIINSFESEGYSVVSIERGKSMSDSTVNFICPNGHKHKVLYTNWKHQKTRCAYCAGNGRKLLSDIRKEFADENYLLLTKSYKNNNQLLEFICPNNHKYSIRYVKWQQGHRCRKCYNERQSVCLCGSNNNAWKGGIACEPYCYEWSFRGFKDLIKERDGNKCLNLDCWGTSERLSVHHIDYNKKNCSQSNLITLCTSCNARANTNRKWHEAWYSSILFRRYNIKKKQ